MAFELKKLEVKLKDKGLPEIEDLAEKSIEALCEFLEEEAPLQGGLVAAIIPAAVALIKPIAMKAADKIDGKEG